MKKFFSTLLFVLMFKLGIAQPIIDLSQDKQKAENISLEQKKIKIINKLPTKKYKLVYIVEKTDNSSELIPPFDVAAFAGESSDCGCNAGINKKIDDLFTAATEKELGKRISDLRDELKGDDGCKKLCLAKLEKILEATIAEEDIDVTLENNQTITVVVIRDDNDGKFLTWTKTLKTPRTSRWLTHYGLTYAPAIISKDSLFFSKTDTSTANRFIVTPQHNRSPRPWDNISATINFTYPFSSKVKGLDLGFTAGFGLNPGLQLSGHTGLSAIIGTNVILGTGVVLMQKYNLRGQFADKDVIRENLNFEALHEKVWRPEIYFTIGFRFNKNPFAGSSDKKEETSTDKKGGEVKTPEAGGQSGEGKPKEGAKPKQ
jgi:hypothetical protein